jgi:hypothetical protein
MIDMRPPQRRFEVEMRTPLSTADARDAICRSSNQARQIDSTARISPREHYKRPDSSAKAST